MIPAVVVFVYLAFVLYIGIFAFRTRGRGADAEEYFLAGRSLGPAVFLLSLFGTNMTAFSILGASGHAFANGIVTYGLMASSSALVIPLSLLLIGTRLWALGKRHGFMTPVQMFRDRWECGHIGTVIFARAGGAARPLHHHRRHGRRHDAADGQRRAGAVLARRRASSRSSSWAMCFSAACAARRGSTRSRPCCFCCSARSPWRWSARAWAGSGAAMETMLASPSTAPLLTRERVSPLLFPQLHVHPAVVDRVSAHRDLLPDGAAPGPLQEDDRPVSDLHARDLAAVGLSRRGRPTRRRAVPAIAAKLEARATLAAPGPTRLPTTSAIGCARRRPETMWCCGSWKGTRRCGSPHCSAPP